MATATAPSIRKRIDLGFRPHIHQQEVIRGMATKRFGVLVTHRRWGKTKYAVANLSDSALRCRRPNGRYAYIAPFRNQAKAVAWMYLTDIALRVPGARKNESELYVEFPNGARVTLYGADNAEALRGLYLDGAVIDEVGDIDAVVWFGIIRPTLADRDGWCLFIGTPKGQNLFYDLRVDAEKNPDWFLAIYPCDETSLPWLPQSEIDAMREEMSDSMFRQEMLCDFSASSDNILIPIDAVTRACHRAIVHESDLRGLPKIIMVDVGRYGGDPSVLMRSWGPVVYDPVTIDGKDNMHVAGVVAWHIEDFNPDAVHVDGGRGEGVIDRLRQMGYPRIVEVNGAAKPSNERYLNKRAESWDLMRADIETRAVLPNHPKLKRELSVPFYHFKNSGGKFQLVDKEWLREQLGTSTDYADTLALKYAYPVTKRREELVTDYRAVDGYGQQSTTVPYDRKRLLEARR